VEARQRAAAMEWYPAPIEALFERVRNCVVSGQQKKPAEIARRLAKRGQTESRESAWRRETYTLKRGAARDKAREYFLKFPKAAYMTEIESWRELPDDCIEFTIRRLPSAD
jgi:hypothetical protein